MTTPDPRLAARYAGTRTSAAEYDAGLRSYMIGIYNYMLTGLAVTGFVAYGLSMLLIDQATGQPTQLMMTLFGSPLKWLVMLSPFAFILVLSFGIQRLSSQMAAMLFFAFSAVMGVSLSTIFLAYTGTSIAQVFFITAGVFGAMSLWGYTTKRDLTSMGSFLFMGLIGIVIASIVNMFLNSDALGFAISIIGVLVFTGLTAWDTQRLRDYYEAGMNGELQAKTSVMGALSLYLNFINLFLMLLSLLGNRE
ncbi:MAG: Bax inhibitor-1/YccA family protein [Alphaproteobacteria bacterium]|nr:Bax inhibitor-1/YccA family protein [Alphaproteobacteria bacterium]